jgi:hypothetical protein
MTTKPVQGLVGRFRTGNVERRGRVRGRGKATWRAAMDVGGVAGWVEAAKHDCRGETGTSMLSDLIGRAETWLVEIEMLHMWPESMVDAEPRVWESSD